MNCPRSRSSREVALRLILAVAVSLALACPANAEGPSPALELTRTVRPWEFLSSVGQRAGLFGNEAGNFEAWVYPLKILRDFHLKFLVDGRAVPAEALARTLTVRPESSTILYTGDTFAVRETFFVPVHEPGAVIILRLRRRNLSTCKLFSNVISNWNGRLRWAERILIGTRN